MLPKTSADYSATPAPPSLYRSADAGAIDALTNFWFKRIEVVNPDQKTTAEMNLERSAEAARCLKPQCLTNEQCCIEGMFEDGFSTEARIAAILVQQPFDAEAPLRRLLDEHVAVIRERREDATTSRAAHAS